MEASREAKVSSSVEFGWRGDASTAETNPRRQSGFRRARLPPTLAWPLNDYCTHTQALLLAFTTGTQWAGEPEATSVAVSGGSTNQDNKVPQGDGALKAKASLLTPLETIQKEQDYETLTLRAGLQVWLLVSTLQSNNQLSLALFRAQPPMRT